MLTHFGDKLKEMQGKDISDTEMTLEWTPKPPKRDNLSFA